MHRTLEKKQSKVTEKNWIVWTCWKSQSGHRCFTVGHGWSRLVTGGHGSVPLYLVLGVSPRSRVVTGGHGSVPLYLVLGVSPRSRVVTGGHGSVPVYLVLGVYPRSRLVTGGHGLFLKRNTKQF